MNYCCSSVAKLCPTLCDPMNWSIPLLWPPLSHRVYSNSYPLSQWCYLTNSSSASLFSFCLQSFPESGSFPMNWLFTSDGQRIGPSASATVLPMNIQSWFPLGLTDLISLQSKGLSRVISNTTVRKHQFFSAQPSLWSSFHIHKWLLEKTIAASLMAQRVKNLPAMQETQVRSLGQEDPQEKGMTPQSSILAWRIPWTEEPGRL